MGGAESVDVRIANSSDKIILFRYICENSNVESQSSTKKANFGVAGTSAGGEISKSKNYSSIKAPEPGFSSLSPGNDILLSLPLKGSSIVNVTIKVEGGDVIWDNLQQKKKRNLVITKDLHIKTADDKDPFEVHPNDQYKPPERNLSTGQNSSYVTGENSKVCNKCKTTKIESSSESTENLQSKTAGDKKSSDLHENGKREQAGSKTSQSETGDDEKGSDEINIEEIPQFLRPMRRRPSFGVWLELRCPFCNRWPFENRPCSCLYLFSDKS